MSTETRERLNDLDVEQRAERHLNQQVDGGQNVANAQVMSHGNGVATLSYFTDANEGPLSKSDISRIVKAMGRGRAMPEGYRPVFKSMSQYLRDGMRNPEEWRRMAHEAGESLVKAGHIKKSNSFTTFDSESAGALVLPEFADKIASHQYEDHDLLGQTDQYTISGNSMKLPRVPGRSRKRGQRHGGITSGWVDEGDLISTARGKFEKTELALKKLAVVVFLTDELIEDNSYALEQWVTRAVRDELAFMTGDALVNGTGGGMPLGYTQSGAASVIDRQTTSHIEAKDVLNLYSHRRPGVPLSEYCWHINQEAEVDLQTMILGTGGNQEVVYLPPGKLADTPHAHLMGLPVKSLEFSPALGQKGDIALVRMKGMASITKGAINETSSSHVAFLTDETAIKFTQRLDARPMYDSPTKAYQGSSNFEYSDFVVLNNN